MLSIYSKNEGKFCDGMSRRGFLRVGGLSLGGASLPQILSADTSKSGLGHKAIIMIFLAGGPPHQDMWDIKRDAPTNIRGEFNTIKTKVPGIEICELFPKIASMADKFAFIRSIVGAQGGHDAQQCLTGKSPRNAPAGGWPSIGSVMSSIQGPASTAVPVFVGLSPKCGHDQWGDPGQPGFCGPSHSAFTPNRGGGASDVELKGISGGGMQVGGAIGKTDRLGGEAAERPVHFAEIFATLYKNMGIDASQATVTDLGGRPRYLVEGYDPIKELI